MNHEREIPVLSIEHWDYQMASAAGHPKVGVLGMFIDVAVLRVHGKAIKVQQIKDLKIEWERFKRDEVYASEMLALVEQMLTT